MKNYFFEKIQKFFYKNLKIEYESLTKYPFETIQDFKWNKSLSIKNLIYNSKKVNGSEYGNFLVLCLGKAGSTWLASSLNLHPEVTCSVGIDHPVNSLSYPYNQDLINKYIDSIRTSNAVRYGAISLDKEYSKKVKKSDVNYSRYAAGTIIKEHLNKLNINIDIPPRYNIEDLYPIILKELKEISFFKGKYYGNVHGMDCRRFIESLKKNKNSYYKNLKVVDLIANPVKRMESIKNAAILDCKLNIGNYINIIENFINDNKILVKKIENDFKVDFSNINNKIIFHNYYFFNYPLVHAQDIVSLNVPKINFELIKNDTSDFKKLFNYLTDNKIYYSQEYENEVFSDSMKGFGRHLSNEEHTDTPEDIFTSWSDWEKTLFLNVVKQFNLKSFYNKYGYDLSFLERY